MSLNFRLILTYSVTLVKQELKQKIYFATYSGTDKLNKIKPIS